MGKAVSMNIGKATILIETDDSVTLPQDATRSPTSAKIPEGFEPVARIDGIRKDFDEVTALIADCCNELYTAITRIPKPETVSIEFGVKLGGEAGVPMLTKATGEATFKISVVWKSHGNERGD